jgi:oligopeptide transport system substrate-binding protein
LDSFTAQNVEWEAQLLAHLQEGLLRLDKRGKLVPGVAKSWTIEPDQIRFTLRRDARWQNGEPVTAHDFVFAWRRLVDPATASPFAGYADPIKHASSVVAGELPAESLGVRAESDHLLIVDLEQPSPWFLKTAATSILYPLNEEFVNRSGVKFGSSPETHLSNGTFLLETWDRAKRIQLSRNPYYWQSDGSKLELILYDYFTNDGRSQLNLFLSGEIAAVTLTPDTITEALELGRKFRSAPIGNISRINFSYREGRPGNVESLRRAINYAIDEILTRISTMQGTKVAYSAFHSFSTIGAKMSQMSFQILR